MSDDEYEAFVAQLSDETAAALHAAKGDPSAQRRALIDYYRRGEAVEITAAELIDFLAVSTPSILDHAGYTEAEGDALMAISDALTDADLA